MLANPVCTLAFTAVVSCTTHTCHGTVPQLTTARLLMALTLAQRCLLIAQHHTTSSGVVPQKRYQIHSLYLPCRLGSFFQSASQWRRDSCRDFLDARILNTKRGHLLSFRSFHDLCRRLCPTPDWQHLQRADVSYPRHSWSPVQVERRDL